MDARKTARQNHRVTASFPERGLGYNSGYPVTMKTAVSMPDDLFRRAEAAARRLRVSRSGLYAKAIAEFLKGQQGNAITERLNDVYSRNPAKVESLLHRAQLKSLEWTPGRDGRDSARGDLLGRSSRTSPLRAWIQAAGACGPGRLL